MGKICEQCLKEKDEDKFYEQKRKKQNYLDKVCKDCRKDNQLDTSKRIRDWLNAIKTPCVICGEERKHVIDFHHRNQEDKKFNISRYSSSGATKFEIKQIQLLKEIEKCICLCSNCHRDFHYYERIEGINFQVYSLRLIRG